MSRVEFRPAAARDLEDIGDYVAQHSPQAALALIRRLRETCRSLAEMPYAARARPELGEQIRSRPVGRYTVFFRPREDGIEVVRVLHGRRDVAARSME